MMAQDGRAGAARRRVSAGIAGAEVGQAEGVAPPFERGGFGSAAV
jgi:hypothetical protein